MALYALNAIFPVFCWCFSDCIIFNLSLSLVRLFKYNGNIKLFTNSISLTSIDYLYFLKKVEIFSDFPFVDSGLLLLLWRASLLRSAPFELPQVGNEARVESCSDAIRGACPFFTFNVKKGSPLLFIPSFLKRLQCKYLI